MVKYASSLMYGPGMAEWQDRIDVARMRKERADRLRGAMKRHGVAVALMARAENVRYAVGNFYPPLAGQFGYCMFFVEHAPILWDWNGQYSNMVDQMSWIKPENFRIARFIHEGTLPEAKQDEAKLMVAEIKQELKNKGLTGEKLGTVGLHKYAMMALEEAGIETIDIQDIVEEARLIKTQDEINCLKMSAAIADAGQFAVYEVLKPGARDVTIKAAVTKALLEAGAESTAGPDVWSGPWTWPRAVPNTDRIVRPGDIVLVDIDACRYMGYCSCYYRTFKVCTKPTEKEKDWYKKVLDKNNAIIDAIKPGATTADLAKHMEPASSWGYPDEIYAMSFDICHGIGLTLHEGPIASRLWSLKHPQVLEVGMTMAIETIHGEWREGSARLEDMAVITEKGAELIGRFPRDEIIVTCPIQQVTYNSKPV
jgi:Xaa-Pro aminopeptidase